MTIERAPSTNGHLKHADATRREPDRAPIDADQAVTRSSGPRRRVPVDIRGLLLSALVAAGMVFILRRIERGTSD